MDIYQELEGRKIKVTAYGQDYDAIVTGCDKDVGVTIQDMDGNRIFCIMGPGIKGTIPNEKVIYPLLLGITVAAIRHGAITDRTMAENSRILSLFEHSVNHCPYGVPADKCAFV